ncbi:UNVERIFIED_CONTAM: Ethylene-insensitive protein 2 [Sesamum radiatum]|uniref:Ethylene-insensitive protein 2 n=1 Tax=Sesamum radiatum TaxID=300843 RepID=A0AAW2R4P0_SESRA
MESETSITDYPPTTRQRVLAAVGPVLWIAVSYVDPGKWAAAVEGGARFGSDLVLLVLIINCATILCQYLSALVAIATGKDLSQVLGTAYGLNAVSGISLWNCVFLTGFDAVLFPFLASFLQDQGQTNVSKAAMCHDHFFSTLCAFSGIFVVNCVLMNLAANVFYSSGFISLTLQDALSLLDQGIIDLAFSEPRLPKAPCFCLQLPVGYQQKSSPPISNDSLPPPSKQGRGRLTTSLMLLDIIKDVEMAISCRKGRTGTAAGDVAFPKGKENLASVLKRYKRRLSNKPVGSQEVAHGLRKIGLPSPQGS